MTGINSPSIAIEQRQPLTGAKQRELSLWDLFVERNGLGPGDHIMDLATRDEVAGWHK